MHVSRVSFPFPIPESRLQQFFSAYSCPEPVSSACDELLRVSGGRQWLTTGALRLTKMTEVIKSLHVRKWKLPLKHCCACTRWITELFMCFSSSCHSELRSPTSAAVAAIAEQQWRVRCGGGYKSHRRLYEDLMKRPHKGRSEPSSPERSLTIRSKHWNWRNV